jgi:hypothetical protein
MQNRTESPARHGRPNLIAVPPEVTARAAALAARMTADPDATAPGDFAWTAQEVLRVALGRGLDALDHLYSQAAGAEEGA